MADLLGCAGAAGLNQVTGGRDHNGGVQARRVRGGYTLTSAPKSARLWPG